MFKFNRNMKHLTVGAGSGSSLLLLLGALLLSSSVIKADQLKDLIKSNGFIEIKLVEAHVPDMDPLPLQKDSDVFVRVYLNDTKELVCESQVIQDENKPKFDKDCRTSKAVSADSIVRFELYDSDKPAQNPDYIGLTKVRVSDLILNRKLDSKESFPIEGRQFPKYFIKAKIDFKPEK